jgi:hypothetical protein
MTFNLDTALGNGERLATIDGVAYIAIHLVYECAPDEPPVLYCPRSEWRATTAGRLAEREREIAELEVTLSRQAEEALKQFRRAEEALARAAELEQELASFRQSPAIAVTLPHTCPEPGCGRSFKNAHALAVHRGTAHARAARVVKVAPIVPIVEVPSLILSDDPTWHGQRALA